MWRKNCSLKAQKQPLFWDNSNKKLINRHLQRARKLDKMSSNRTQIIGLSHPGRYKFRKSKMENWGTGNPANVTVGSTLPRVGPYVYFTSMNPWRFSNFMVVSWTYFMDVLRVMRPWIRHFRSEKRSRIWRQFTILLRKCGAFLLRRLQFSLWSDYLEDGPAPAEESQHADEENATFS